MKNLFAFALFSAWTVSSFGQTFNYTGTIVTHVIPAGVTTIQIDAYGAQGGAATSSTNIGGLGARICGTVPVIPGDTLYILVGQKGEDNGNQAGGGGGTFVVKRVASSPYQMTTGRYVMPLVIAGGGGGAYVAPVGTSSVPFVYGSIGTAGSNTVNTALTPVTLLGGTGGNGGETWHGGGGGGFITNGVQLPGSGNTVASYGLSFLNLGAGGITLGGGNGGFGGGGAGHAGFNAGGAGGGYSGGAGGRQSYGGGGGSFNSGTSQNNFDNVRVGNGMVVITPALSATISLANSITCNGGSDGALMVSANFGTSPYTYLWNPTSQSTATATGLSAGTYTVTVTDATFATTTATFSLTQPAPIVLSQLSQNNVSCFGGNNGSAAVNPATSPNPISAIDNVRAASNWSQINSVANAGYANGISFESWVKPNAGWVSSDGMIFAINTSTGSNRFMLGYNATQQRFVYFDDVGGNRFQTGTAPGGQWHHIVLTVSNTSLVNMYVDGVSVLNYQSGIPYSIPPSDLISIGQEFDGIGVTSQFFDGLIDEVRIWNSVLSPAAVTTNMGECPYLSISNPNYANLVAYYKCDEGTGSLLNDASPNNRDGVRMVGNSWAIPTQITYGCYATSPGGITYDWSPGTPPGDGTTSVTGLTSGTYTCTATDPLGCTASVTFNITQPAASVAGNTVVTNVACFGGNTGAINLTPTGGTGPYTFVWSTGHTTEDRTSLSAGTYSVQITDANGCTGTVTGITVTQPASAVSGTTVVTNVACFGGVTGAINLTPSGGTSPYTFLWSTGHTTEDRTGLASGTYAVTITDANGCTAVVNSIVTQPTALNVSSGQTNVACFGGATGAANVSVSGGVPSYSYNWTPGNPTGDGTPSVTGLTAGTWTCTITDANSCVATQTFNLISPPAIVVTPASQTNVSCNGGSNGAATINTPTGGVGGYTYDWTPGNPLGDGTTSVTGLTSGSWTCTITDANSCTATVTFNITQPGVLSASSVAGSIACNGGSTTITVAGTGGVSPYTGEGTFTVTAGTYTYTVTDANGCTATTSVTVTEPSAISPNQMQNNITCAGGPNGHLMVSPSGGTGAYTYAWAPIANSTNVLNGSPAGFYTCTITDANGCTATATFNLTEPSALSVSTMQTNVLCNGATTGDAMVMVSGGVSPYTYAWSSGGTGATETGLGAGSYTCTITDANSCTSVSTVTITEPTAMSVTTMQTNVLCNGATTGDAMVMVSGGVSPYTYAWSSGGTGATETGLAAGSYTCTTTDANSCTSVATVTITEPSAISTSVTQVNVSCNGGTDGSIDLTVSGGVSPYTFDWNSGTYTTEDISGLTAGSYIIVVTDANGCTVSGTLAVVQPSQIAHNGVVTDATGCTTNDGVIDLTTLGGTGPYTFAWSNSATSEDISGLDGGVYSVTITDANNCTESATFTITEPGAPTVTYSEPIDTACGGSLPTPPFALSGESPAGGTWSGPGVSANMFDASLANVGMNIITYSYTDAGGCSAVATDSIYVDLCMGVNTIAENTFTMYPNPTTGLINITTNGPYATIIVTDALGQQVFSVVTNSTTTQVDLSQNANGMYFVRVEQNGSYTTQRVIIAK